MTRIITHIFEDGCPDLTLRWDHAFHGTSVDDRGNVAIRFASQRASSIHVLRYDPSTFDVSLDDRSCTSDTLGEIMSGLTGSILLEATTLNFVEVLLLRRALMEIGIVHLDLLYIEPKNYSQPPRHEVIRKRRFELSESFREFTAVPGNVGLISPEDPAKAIIFVGFEGQRLARVLEQTQFPPSQCSIVFGIPAFSPGWEMHAFANNIATVKERQLDQHVLFAAARNPAASYETLVRVRESCSQNEKLFIVPIGTKPHGIGVALYAAENEDVGVIYDFPKPRGGRSTSCGDWLLYKVISS